MTLMIHNARHDVNDRFHLRHCDACAKLRAKIDARGTHFAEEELKQIEAVWAAVAEPVKQDTEGATFKLSNGETFRITHSLIEVPKTPTPEWYERSMEHIAANWNGSFHLVSSRMLDPNYTPDERCIDLRLRSRAYAEIYGLHFTDGYDQYHPLSQKDLDRVPSIIRGIKTQKALGALFSPLTPMRFVRSARPGRPMFG
jgi:hypothetical protein